MKHLDQDTLIHLRKRMLRKAEISNHHSPEDIASEYVARLLEGYHTRATIDQAYIDICRLSSGRKGQPGYKAKKCLNNLALTEEQQDHADLQPNPFKTLDQDDLMDLEKQISRIQCGRTKDIFTYLLMGLTLQEIGDKYGLTQSRVQQIVSREITYLRESISS